MISKAMKKTATILACILAVPGCRSKQAKSCAELDAVVSQDSIFISHQWHDDGFLFGRPAESQLAQWKELCGGDFHCGSLIVEEYGSPERALAILDFHEFLDSADNDIDEKTDFILWRLSEYMPIFQSQPDEYTRFSKLDIQIDRLLNYAPATQMLLNDRSYYNHLLAETRAKIMYRRLLKHIEGSLKHMFREENQAFEHYDEVLTACYDTVVIGHDSFSSYPMFIYGMAKGNSLMRRKSLEPFYFFVTDGSGTADRGENHTCITMKMIDTEYDKFISGLPTIEYFPEDPVLYPLQVRQRNLNNDRKAFRQWMNMRRKISSVLAGDAKIRFDQATNNARRDKLLMLKNRYEGYGLVGPFDDFLKYDCTDRELLEYQRPENLYEDM